MERERERGEREREREEIEIKKAKSKCVGKAHRKERRGRRGREASPPLFEGEGRRERGECSLARPRQAPSCVRAKNRVREIYGYILRIMRFEG